MNLSSDTKCLLGQKDILIFRRRLEINWYGVTPGEGAKVVLLDEDSETILEVNHSLSRSEDTLTLIMKFDLR